MIHTTRCHKCGCETGDVVQWLSKATGRGIKQYSVICSNCWNINVKANEVCKAIGKHDKIAQTYNIAKDEVKNVPAGSR